MNLLLKKLRPAVPRTLRVSVPQVLAPRVFPTTGFTQFPTSETIEEEHWAWYTPQSFYPVRIGDVLHEKYQIICKLGYGTTATVWLCRDLRRRRNDYVCLKSMVCDYSSVQREIKAYETLSKAAENSKAAGKLYVREALDRFELQRGGRQYDFLVHEPLGVSVQFFLDVCRGSLPFFYVKELASQMLHALEFIHSAGVIHADLQAKNILLHIHDKQVLQEGEEDEIKRPSSRKITEQTAIFETRDFPGPLTRWMGDNSGPVLCDFGEARTGKDSYTEFIQPEVYRAPQIFLHLSWGTPADIWNFGCMIWDLMFHRHLFPRKDENAPELISNANQLAQMVALLGPPPPELLADSGPRALEFFNEDGSPKSEVPNESLESVLAASLERAKKTMSVEESTAFLAFIRRALTWTEESRATASDLLKDPWLKM